MLDTYQTIAEASTGEFRDRGSKFFAYAFPVYDLDSIKSRLEEVRKEHPKARHHCYAYRLGLDKTNFRANDDGEPSGTAGKPILGQLDSYNVTYTLIVVVRYFGGTLLGTSGLINAYRNGASDALNNASIIEKLVEDIYQLTFDYAIMSDVMNAVKKNKLEIIFQSFEAEGVLKIAIRQSQLEETLRRLRAQIAKVRIEEIDQIETIDGLEINFLYTR